MYEKVQFTVSLKNDPVPVTILESRGSSLEKSASAKQQKLKSASIKNEKQGTKPDLPGKPIENLVQAVQQGVARVQEQTQEIAKIQSQLQILNEPRAETKLVELNMQSQNQVDKRINLLEQSTSKIAVSVEHLLSKISTENEHLRKEQSLLKLQMSEIQKSNAELLNKLDKIKLDIEAKPNRKVLKSNAVQYTAMVVATT
eukprot:NODE_153_length_16933_cov_0.442141.p8 type:complete len:200 gc:universal NODE_153_length_16933_cov_0.442141:15848-16447(+)